MAGLHFSIEKDVEMEVYEVFQKDDKAIGTVAIKIEGVNIVLTTHQAERLADKLDKFLFEDPSYKDLDELCSKLRRENEELREQISQGSQNDYDKYDMRRHDRLEEVV